MKKTLLSSLLAVVVCLTLLPVQLKAQEQQTPTRWGINYWAGFWRPDETATLSQLPLSFVRWGGNASDSGQQSTDMTAVFASSMHKQHIEPLFQISMFHTTPEQAADFVTEINIDKQLGLKYWSIGNEPELFVSTHQDKMTLDEYLTKWRALAVAMRKADPSIQLVGPDVSLPLSTLDQSSRAWQWFDAFLKVNGDLLDVVAFHFYPFGGDPVPAETILNNPDVVAPKLAQLKDTIQTTLKRQIPIMITEINLNWNDGASGQQGSDSLFAGMWLAEIFGLAAQQGLGGVLPWTAVRNAHLSILDSMSRPRPTYYAIQDYADFGAAIDHPQVSVSGVKAYAGMSDQGLRLIVVNRNADPVTLNLASDISLGSSYKFEDKTIRLEGYSFTRLTFDGKGSFVEGTTYSQHEFDTQTPPSPILPASK